jgi:hypothetical protein
LPQDASGVFKDRREPDSIGIVMPVGFYKRGCQEKTLFLFREEGIFF